MEELRADFRREVGYWKSRHADAVKRIKQLKEELDQSRGQPRALRDKLFGRKSANAYGSASVEADSQRQLRHLDYLALLQFFLNHRRFLRSERPERVGKSPAELLGGSPQRPRRAGVGTSLTCSNCLPQFA